MLWKLQVVSFLVDNLKTISDKILIIVTESELEYSWEYNFSKFEFLNL